MLWGTLTPQAPRSCPTMTMGGDDGPANPPSWIALTQHLEKGPLVLLIPNKGPNFWMFT